MFISELLNRFEVNRIFGLEFKERQRGIIKSSMLEPKSEEQMENAKDENVPDQLRAEINASRERLRLNKPLVYDKLMQYLEKEKKGIEPALSLLDWAYGFECNFRCPHCCADTFRKRKIKNHLSFPEIKNMSEQIDQLGIFIINLIGGEPLAWKNLDEIISAIDPKKFHISLTTNGWLLDREKAFELAKLGVDKIGVSIDSGLEAEHDLFRNKQGSYKKAVAALDNAKQAGIRTMISTVVTHQNIRSDGFKRLIDISLEKEVTLDLQCATVAGGWRGNHNVLINAEDAAYLESLRERYPLLRRDVWSVPGSAGGCPAVTRSMYIIPTGDVLPCLFIHVSFGNIKEEPLQGIVEKMLCVKEFTDFSGICLAGEDMTFIDKYLSKTYVTDDLPISYKNVFTVKS